MIDQCQQDNNKHCYQNVFGLTPHIFGKWASFNVASFHFKLHEFTIIDIAFFDANEKGIHQTAGKSHYLNFFVTHSRWNTH